MQCFGSKYFIYVLLGLNIISFTVSEPITLSLVGSALLATWYNWDTVKENTLCRVAECCNDGYIPYDLEKLKQSLSQHLFGQPLAHNLVKILRAHKEIVYNKNKQSQKALVLSFHGWPGVGKNYAATMIAEALYTKGMASKYVKLFMGDKDFDCNNVNKSKKELTEKVAKVVTKCPRSLIIFDEIHHMCASVLDAIKPMIDHHQAVDGIDYRDSIFIFISNIGAESVAHSLLEYLDKNGNRDAVELEHFEDLIRKKAYNAGGFQKAYIIAHHLIDHYIPFLPLELVHVEECAKCEFRRNGILHPTEKMMQDVLSIIKYGPSDDRQVFANTGCKRLSKYVPFIIQKYNDNRTEL